MKKIGNTTSIRNKHIIAVDQPKVGKKTRRRPSIWQTHKPKAPGSR